MVTHKAPRAWYSWLLVLFYQYLKVPLCVCVYLWVVEVRWDYTSGMCSLYTYWPQSHISCEGVASDNMDWVSTKHYVWATADSLCQRHYTQGCLCVRVEWATLDSCKWLNWETAQVRAHEGLCTVQRAAQHRTRADIMMRQFWSNRDYTCS